MSVNTNIISVGSTTPIPEGTFYGTDAPTSTGGYSAGDMFYVTPLGTQEDSENATEVWRFDGTKWVKAPSGGEYPLHQEEVIVASQDQTAFTLTKEPIGDTGKVIVTRNGVTISDAFTWVGTTGTYDPALNYNCVIDENDKLIFHYESL
jgi:hypothetical protein